MTNGDLHRPNEKQKPVPVPVRPDPSDAESVSTTTSQDSRESNKENRPRLEEGVTLRKKADYHRVRDYEIERKNPLLIFCLKFSGTVG